MALFLSCGVPCNDNLYFFSYRAIESGIFILVEVDQLSRTQVMMNRGQTFTYLFSYTCVYFQQVVLTYSYPVWRLLSSFTSVILFFNYYYYYLINLFLSCFIALHTVYYVLLSCIFYLILDSVV